MGEVGDIVTAILRAVAREVCVTWFTDKWEGVDWHRVEASVVEFWLF